MSDVLDLSTCEREAIRVPGSIQPSGALLALDRTAFAIQCASQNVVRFFGRSASELIGRSVFDLFDTPYREMLEERLLGDAPEDENPLTVPRARGDGTSWDVAVWLSGEFVLLEIEETIVERPAFLRDVRAAVTRLQNADSLARLCELAASDVARISGFDRVMVYRFDRDWHGEVVAERVNPGVEAYLGLHYPASDIPAQARDLYRTSWLRAIPDVAYVPVPLVPPVLKSTGQPLDLSRATLRSVSPVHIEYLKNMNVGATLTISLLKHGELWGLIAAHHLTPRRLGFETRAACEFLGRTFSLKIAALEEHAALAQRVAFKDRLALISARMADASSLGDALARNEQDLISLMGATGAATRVDGVLTLLGRTPAGERTHAIMDYVDGRSEDLFETSSLGIIEPAFASDAREASGLLAIRLAPQTGNMLVWFREEIPRTVAWGGNPDKAVTAAEVPGRLSPRTSFARWETIVRGRAEAWTPWHFEAARALRDGITSVVLKRTSELERVNSQLERSISELDAFAQIASHDLKEPLRGIHNYASYLMEDYEDVLDDEGREKLQTLVRLTQRMDVLIESLLHLSRVSRVDFDDSVTPLEPIVHEVLDLFSPRIKAAGVEVVIHGPLPVVRVDAVRLREVFNNLISNALKYNESARPRIEIGYDHRPAPVRSGETPPAPPAERVTWVTIWVRDNGIGIREKHLRTIFQMFKRLHPQHRYGGGTGAGLAIARKIVERFGGHLWAESVFGESTTFLFTLPEKDEWRPDA